ncbi:MAG: ABC transporter permease [Chloroflexi bacterium]|nr:ABC transporter permease [Chloroflexota bacterium]
MRKTWLIFVNEYKRHVMKKSFLFGILSMPLFVGFMILIGVLTVWLDYNKDPIGYVDTSFLLVNAQQLQPEEKQLFPSVTAISFESEESAKSAMQAGTIQAYFILSDNYLSTGEVTMVKDSRTGSNASGDFGDFVVYNLLQGKPQDIVTRLSEGSNLIIRSLDGTREMEADNWLSIMLPVLSGVLFMIAVNISGSYLLQAVVEEKESRTMEILVTSVSPEQLMIGKVMGNLLVGLTQLAVWILFAIIALMVVPSLLPIGEVPKIELSYLLLMAATLLPAFVMVAAAMGAVGATAAESREAQQIAGWFTIPIMIPLYFTTSIMYNPNSALSVGMSLFPLTAPIALPLRAMFTNIPVWQIILVITVLCLLAVFALWLSGRMFRLGMLRYGKRVRLREAFERAK